jgi:hypothetical protein
MTLQEGWILLRETMTLQEGWILLRETMNLQEGWILLRETMTLQEGWILLRETIYKSIFTISAHLKSSRITRVAFLREWPYKKENTVLGPFKQGFDKYFI